MVLSFQNKYFYPLSYLLHPYLDVKIALNYIFSRIVEWFYVICFFYVSVIFYSAWSSKWDYVSLQLGWFIFTSKDHYWSILLGWALGIF